MNVTKFQTMSLLIFSVVLMLGSIIWNLIDFQLGEHLRPYTLIGLLGVQISYVLSNLLDRVERLERQQSPSQEEGK
jgi:hypothetical protein